MTQKKTAEAPIETRVEVLIEPGEFHGWCGVRFDGHAYLFGGRQAVRMGADGAYEVVLDGLEDVRCATVHDGEIWFAREHVYRWVPGQEPVEVPIAAEIETGEGCNAIHSAGDTVWLGAHKAVILRSNVGGPFEWVGEIKGGWSIQSLVQTDEGLWISPYSKGVHRLVDGVLEPAGVKGANLAILQLQSGALLMSGDGPQDQGAIWRREPGQEKAKKSKTPKTGWMNSLAQLDDGRVIGVGASVFVSHDDGRTFTELPYDRPKRGSLYGLVAMGTYAIAAGNGIALLKIS